MAIQIPLINLLVAFLAVICIPSLGLTVRTSNRLVLLEERNSELKLEVAELRKSSEAATATANSQQVTLAAITTQLASMATEMARIVAKLDRLMEMESRNLIGAAEKHLKD